MGQPEHKSIDADLRMADPPAWQVICHAGQIVAFNPKQNVSDWAAFRLRREDLKNPKVERKDNFRPDPEVPTANQVVHADYTHSGYDRGHLAPAAAMKWSKEAMDDSFYMTNIAPQVGSGFNQHIWKSLEQKMRQWACKRGTLYVVTGPLYERGSTEQISDDLDKNGVDDNGILVDVPSHFFKFAFDPNAVETIAFILENRKLKTADLPKYLTSIDEIEARSRLDFLPDIWDGAEQSIESNAQPHLWEKPDGSCGKLR